MSGIKFMGKDLNGNAKAINTDNNGNLLVDVVGAEVIEKILDAGTMTFTGKTKENLTINPHSAYVRNHVSFPVTTSDFKITEISDEAYSRITKFDGEALGTGATAINQYGQHTFVFDLYKHLISSGYIENDSTIENMNNILYSVDIKWSGRGQSASLNSASLKHYNHSTQKLELLGTVEGSTFNIIESKISKPILNDGCLYLVAHSNGVNDGATTSAIYTDSISIDVKLIDYGKVIPTSMQVVNIDDNLKSELTGIKDSEGRTVLRVVDAAPFAYNPTTDSIKVEGISAKKGSVIETLVSGVSVDPQELKVFPVSYTTESEVWFAISFDKPSWALLSGSLFAKGSSLSRALYPRRDNEVAAYTIVVPAVSLFLPLPPSTDIATLQEARNYMLSPGENTMDLKFTNRHTEAGLLTIKVIRVWK